MAATSGARGACASPQPVSPSLVVILISAVSKPDGVKRGNGRRPAILSGPAGERSGRARGALRLVPIPRKTNRNRFDT